MTATQSAILQPLNNEIASLSSSVSPNSVRNWTRTRLLDVSLSTNTPSQSKITSSVSTRIQVLGALCAMAGWRNARVSLESLFR
ncbi:hypothetical protein H1Q63_07705 [Desmonostoc muscorum CCALA 125]|nr:hypothetical protein [Desmonostoc muscorum CCALA 125]